MSVAISRELFTTHQLSSHPTIHINAMEVVQVPFKFSCLEIPPVVSIGGNLHNIYCIINLISFSHWAVLKILRYFSQCVSQ